MGRSGPHLIHGYLDEPIRVHTPNGISIGSAILHSSRQNVVHARACPFPKKLGLRIGWSGRHGSFGPPKSSTQTASRSVQPLLRGSLL